MKDYYSILGVSPSAETAEIKRAYRRLAKRYHPDGHAALASDERFGELGEAYAVLSNSLRRRRYDVMQRKEFGHSERKAVGRAILHFWIGGLATMTRVVRAALAARLCTECGGSGFVRFGQGAFAVDRPCPACARRANRPDEHTARPAR